MSYRRLLACLLVVIVLTACWDTLLPAVLNSTPTPLASWTPGASLLPSPTSLPTKIPLPIASPDPTPASATSGGEGSADEGPAPSADEGPPPKSSELPASLGLDPADWHDWPIVSAVPENARQIYLRGQELGNDPHAFSVFGDCQSEPEVFMGPYETDLDLYNALPSDLQETVDWFRGSLNRPSPTAQPGATTGALLWNLWHRNRFTCTSYESPLQCELRLHRPSFVIIQIGSHYETRNQDYMRMILDRLIEAGVVPILATKADNRELDEHVNAEYAELAVEYNIPFWNFWAAVDGLPNRGLYTRDDARYQGDLYFTDQAAGIHRLTALQILDAVRRAVTAP